MAWDKTEKRFTLGILAVLAVLLVASLFHKPPAGNANAPAKVVQVGDVTRIGFEFIKDAKYDYDPQKSAPPPQSLQNLSGKRVEITGYAMPLYSPTGQVEFLLTQSSNGCCFGAPPQLQHMILVRATAGLNQKDLMGTPCTVRGTFTVGEERDESGYVTSLLRIQADSIQPAS